MDVAEQRWRAGEMLQFIPGSPAESIKGENDDNDTTLIPSHNTSLSFEDTLTDESVNRMVAIVEDDSGIGNDSAIIDNTEVNKSVDENDKAQNDDAGTLRKVDKNCKRDSDIWSSPIASGSGDTSFSNYNNSDVGPHDPLINESLLSGDVSTDDVFEDCVDDIEVNANDEKDGVEGKFDRVEQNYSLEMKLALGIEDGKL